MPAESVKTSKSKNKKIKNGKIDYDVLTNSASMEIALGCTRFVVLFSQYPYASGICQNVEIKKQKNKKWKNGLRCFDRFR